MHRLKKVKRHASNKTHGALTVKINLKLRIHLTKLMVQRSKALTNHSAAARSFFSRLARRRSKSSPAWCDDRVSGLDETIRKPFV